MIKLRRPKPQPGHIIRAENALAALEHAFKSKFPLQFNANVYAHPSVKSMFKTAQHNKCAYCETLNPTSHDVIEHYRPKNGWRQRRGDSLNHSAYFWLCYDWRNLLFACDQCNDKGHKENIFPLSNPRARSTARHRSTSRERPLLINPFSTDPEIHITWSRDIPIARLNSRKGRETIQILKLDQDGLLLEQRRLYLLKIEKILLLVESLNPGNIKRADVNQILRDSLKPEAPWSAMIRSNFGARIGRLVD